MFCFNDILKLYEDLLFGDSNKLKHGGKMMNKAKLIDHTLLKPIQQRNK